MQATGKTTMLSPGQVASYSSDVGKQHHHSLSSHLREGIVSSSKCISCRAWLCVLATKLGTKNIQKVLPWKYLTLYDRLQYSLTLLSEESDTCLTTTLWLIGRASQTLENQSDISCWWFQLSWQTDLLEILKDKLKFQIL